MKSAAALLVQQWAVRRGLAYTADASREGRKVIIVLCGGMRREDTFTETGIANIPHLNGELRPHAALYTQMRNSGVTSHYNTISSILTGNWQRLDDWGKSRPAAPTASARC